MRVQLMATNARPLGAAACALLGATATTPASADFEVDTATMVYSETHRVSLVEPVASVRWKQDDRTLGVKLTLDTLTGSSPNGATPASSPQTFTGPSGSKTYTAKAGESPLDDTFKDTRVAIAVDYAAPLAGAWSAAYGVNYSTEYDYESLGGSLRVQRDFNEHNTTLFVGVAGSYDRIDPVGGAPDPLTVLAPPAPGGGDRAVEPREDDGGEDDGAHGPKKHKTVGDVLAGVTQTLDAHSLVRMNLVLSNSSGYQTDPYKVLSVVGADGEPLRYVYERRPHDRTKTGGYVEYLRDFGGDTFRAGYRYLTDDWGIDSHTLEASYRVHVGRGTYVEPQLRWYTQSRADFYHVALYDGEELTVSDASADYRLGGMKTWTAGVQVGHTFQSGSDLSLRLQYYEQNPDESGIPAQAAAGLSKFDSLVPDTKAVMATVAYRFNW
jgi:hypothetical protein